MKDFYQLPILCPCGKMGKSSNEMMIHIHECTDFAKSLVKVYGPQVLVALKQDYNLYKPNEVDKSIDILENIINKS